MLFSCICDLMDLSFLIGRSYGRLSSMDTDIQDYITLSYPVFAYWKSQWQGSNFGSVP